MFAPTTLQEATALFPVQLKEVLDKLTKKKPIGPEQCQWGLDYSIAIGLASPASLSLSTVTRPANPSLGHVALIARSGKSTTRSSTPIPTTPIPKPITDAWAQAKHAQKHYCPYPVLKDCASLPKYFRKGAPQMKLIGSYERTSSKAGVRLLFWEGNLVMGFDPTHTASSAGIGSLAGMGNWFFPQPKLIDNWNKTSPGGVFTWRNTKFRRQTDSETLTNL